MNAKKKIIPLKEETTKIKIKDLLPDSKSYGGNSLAVNIENAETSIANVQYTERIWDRSKSQWMLKHLTCSQADGWMRLRQIGAEMASKRRALNEAKFNYLKKQAEIEVKREDMDTASPANYRLLEIEILEIEAQLKDSLIVIEGALKEIQTLSDMHDSLVETLGEINEEKFEKAQTKAHIKRAMQQAIREVRECGRIRTGNQEYLEQCGISATYALDVIINFLKLEEKGVKNTSLLYDFLEKVADDLEPASDIQLEILGFDKEPNLNLTFTPEDK